MLVPIVLPPHEKLVDSRFIKALWYTVICVLIIWHSNLILKESIFNCTVRISSSPADAAMARLVQGTKMLANGGSDKLFHQTFGVFQGEKILKQYVCYISTPSGPVIGTLYITTKRLAFCSDYPLCHYPFSLHHQCMFYKVLPNLITSIYFK